MQAVFSGLSSRYLDRFAAHSYVMRSEPRRGEDEGGAAPEPPREEPPKPPKKKKNRAGLGYKILTIFLLVIFWPVGLILLWRRKLRWSFGMKLLACVLTLAVCVMLYGFALTYDTGDPKIGAIQDSVNDFVTGSAGKVGQWAQVVGEKAVVVRDGAVELSGALWERGRGLLADGIDEGISLGATARRGLEDLFKTEIKVAEPAPRVELTPEPEAEGGEEISLPTPAPTLMLQTARPEEEAIESDIEDIEAEVEAMEDDPTEAPAKQSGAAPIAGDGVGWMENATQEPEPTAEPVPVITTYTVKPAREATVYYNATGKQYHATSECGKMKTSTKHKLGDVRETDLVICNTCGAPDTALLDEKYIAWIDEANKAHLTNECTGFKEGGFRLMTAEEALTQKLKGCPECGADSYLNDFRNGNIVNVIEK